MRSLVTPVVVLLALPLCCGLAGAQELEYVTSAYWTGTSAVKVVGEYAFCAFVNGLVILDVSDPNQPVLMSRLYCEGNGADVDVWGEHAFLADHLAGLQIIDISDVHHPSVVACYDTPGECSSVTILDDLAYVADGTGSLGGLIILDVSTPSAPQFVSSFMSAGMCEALTIAGDYAYIGGIFCALEIVDISDPYHPVQAAYYTMCSSDRICVVGDRAYVTGSCGGSNAWPDEYSILDILDVSDPTQPAPLGEYIYYTGSSGGEVVVSGGHAFARYRDEQSGQHMIVLDVSDATQPFLVGDVLIEGVVVSLQVEGNFLYAATGSGGLQVFDVGVPAEPEALSAWREARGPIGIAGRDDLGYMTDGLGGLLVLDLSDPVTPSTVAQLPLPGFQNAIQLAGDLACLVNFADGLNLIDISDPAEPALLSSIADDVRSAAVHDGYAYVTAGDEGLRIYDVSDPRNPALISQIIPPGYAWDVEVAGGFAYVCAFHEGLRIVDVADPYHPVLRGGIIVEHEWMQYLTLVDEYAYVPTSNQHLLVFDVSNPDQPTLELTYHVNCYMDDLEAYGDRLYMNTFGASFEWGLTVLDITDRLAPVVLGWRPVPGGAADFLPQEPYVFVPAGGSLVVMALQTSGVGEPALSGAGGLTLSAGSPVLGPADIRFNLPQAGLARVDLLDVTGRHWATLHEGFTASGPGQLVWDGRAAGLTSGTYFLRLRAAGREVTRPLILVR